MAGEPEGFREFVAARQAGWLRSAWLLTGDWGRAEDLVQTALVKTWPYWSRVRDGNPDAYVRRVLMTTYLSWRRRRWQGEIPTAWLPDVPGDGDPMAVADLRTVLARLLPTLPPRQRAVLVLRFMQDLSEAQTAAALGVSTGTVKSQTSRAVAALRRTIDQAGLVREDLV